MELIRFEHVSKTFQRHTGQQLIRHHVTGWFQKKSEEDTFFALRDVSFSLERGQSLGVIGPNGAGKSTLLGLVTGLAHPDEGEIQVNGQVAALLELGSGFHPDLTGAENVRLNASLLGFSKKQTNDLFDSIVDFSGIGDFIDEPLRTYSTGMSVRLAFSVAVNLDPDILIVDEILAVGDQAFQTKCYDRIRQMRAQGKSFVCVSHGMQILLDICDQGIWLERGELMLKGSMREVVAAYQSSPSVLSPELV